MNLSEGNRATPVTPDLIAEAAAWVAILHGPERTSATERGFAQWLKRSDAHARAFEEATAIWEEAKNLPRPARLRATSRSSSTGAAANRFVRFGLPVAAAVAAVTFATVLYIRSSGVSTGVGEQRLLALDDGSNVVLNTDTRVVVHYDRNSRTIELKAGEALFEVAKQPSRPFTVIAGDRRIRALGTSFSVRRDENRVAVTLVEGKVAVAPLNALGQPEKPSVGDNGSSDVIMEPGERVVFEPQKIAKTDRPQLDKVLAWQWREVALDDVMLADAIAEMNRYSRKPVVVDIPDAGSIRVTGLFRAGDSLSFARAVAAAYRLEVVEQDGAIRLFEKHEAGTASPR
jgi:transmembrane sensor